MSRAGPSGSKSLCSTLRHTSVITRAVDLLSSCACMPGVVCCCCDCWACRSSCCWLAGSCGGSNWAGVGGCCRSAAASNVGGQGSVSQSRTTSEHLLPHTMG